MALGNGPVGGFPISRFRLSSGLEILEQWADSAGQAAKNALYKALFAIAEGSVYHSHEVVDHYPRPNELTVKVRDDLFVRVHVHGGGMFEILFIGPVEV